VTFAVTTDNSTVPNTTLVSGVTNASGVATTTYTAGATTGTDTVTATASSAVVSGAATISVIPSNQIASIQLLSSNAQLLSGANGSVTLTAFAKDGSNNLMTGVDIAFAVDSEGTLQVTRATTDSTGTAEAILSSPTNITNRTLTVTANSGSITTSTTIDVTGAAIGISGSTTLVVGGTTTLSLVASDGSDSVVVGETLTITSASGNTLNGAASPATVTTGVDGSASLVVTGAIAGADTITVTGIGVSSTYTLSVSTASTFSLTVENPPGTPVTEINLGDSATIEITWQDGGLPVADGSTVTFNATRGTFAPPAASCTTIAGVCSVTISSTNAGPAEIVASTASGPSTSSSIEFLAVLDGLGAETINLQANKVSLATNGDTSTLTAVVRDENSNFVKGATVNFSLVDVTGGTISPLFDVTDSLGRATTTYTSSAASSSTNGVQITATEVSQGLTSTETLTVANQQLFITLGTSNLLSEQTGTTTILNREFAVFVTDAFGNPASNISIQIGAQPLQPGINNLPADDTSADTKAYRKGYWQVVTVGSTEKWVQVVQAYCNTEDLDLDGILDVGEDLNGSGRIEPGNAVYVPNTVVTDATGYATFNVSYAKNFAYWASVELSASASVGGTESITKHKFTLTGLGSDYSDVTTEPPGFESPFGIQNACSNQY
jgi:hypothetical protein